MRRRRFLTVAALAGAGTTIGGCSVASTVRAPTPPAPSFVPFSIELGPVRVTALRTGAVAVKAAHREYGGPSFLRLPSIVCDPRWTPWLPVTCWLIEHPERLIVVDTGETARTAEPDYFACDPGTAFVYERLLRFDVAADREVGPQLRALGIPPEEVRTVVLTHLHSDHAGGLAHFPNAQFMLSRTEAAQPAQGALPCRWPAFFTPQPIDYNDGAFGAFTASYALTSDGLIRAVATPGHTRGHQSVLIGYEDEWALLAGDASFSLDQVQRRAVAGICEDPNAARRTLATIAEHVDQFETRYLAAHDPAAETQSEQPE
ncbi:MAG: N-acyl homoserine lactonase family protein [Bacteroidota bacterium]